MALRNILKDDDPGLLKKSRKVTDFNKRLHILLDDMRETLADADGLGLAAPQVGVLRRVALVVDSSVATQHEESDESKEYEEQEDQKESVEQKEDKFIELVNPELICREGEQSGSEGCLSKPGVLGIVTRPQTVTVKAQDRYGETFEFTGSDITARAICHEIDHLDGIIFTSIAERILTPEEIEEMRKEREI